MKQVCNEQGLCLDILYSLPNGAKEENVHTVFGGDDRNPTWEEYVDDYKEEFQPHMKLIRQSLEVNNRIGETASRCANSYNFSFSDGNVFRFSWRAWGDLMQAIVNKKEGYMAYYM